MSAQPRHTGPHIANGEPVPPRALAEFWLADAAHALEKARVSLDRARATAVPEVIAFLDGAGLPDCSEAAERRFREFARQIAEEGWTP